MLLKNIDKLGQIIGKATSAGANISNGLYFDVLDREGTYNQAVIKAIANAKLSAQTLAKSAGGQLGSVINVVESSSYNPYPIYQGIFDKAEMGSTVPVSYGTIDISATVDVTYELK